MDRFVFRSGEGIGEPVSEPAIVRWLWLCRKDTSGFGLADMTNMNAC